MNRLKKQFVYLAGNIDHVDDLGVEWRDEITPFLKNELGMVVINPCKKPKNLIGEELHEDVDNRQKRKELKGAGKFDELHETMNPIAQADLHFVDKSNVVIVGIDLDKRPCGTIWEICVANFARKPIIILCEQGKKQLPDWLFALLPHQLFFETWDEVKDYLRHIASAPKIETYGRWRLFDFEQGT